MKQQQLFIMVKEPRPGRVKTRLGRDLGMVQAAWWFRHQSARLIRSVSGDPRWRTVLAISPDFEGLNSRVWPYDLPRWSQGKGDLGKRMARIFQQAPKGPIVIVGADVPQITPKLINKAFRALGDHDAVFGPAPDGGYWLIGLRRGPVPKNLFNKVRWSTKHALADTISSLGDVRVAQIDMMRDVDTLADLKAISNIGS